MTHYVLDTVWIMTHETHDSETHSQLKKNIFVDRGSGICYHDTIGEHHHVCV